LKFVISNLVSAPLILVTLFGVPLYIFTRVLIPSLIYHFVNSLHHIVSKPFFAFTFFPQVSFSLENPGGKHEGGVHLYTYYLFINTLYLFARINYTHCCWHNETLREILTIHFWFFVFLLRLASTRACSTHGCSSFNFRRFKKSKSAI